MDLPVEYYKLGLLVKHDGKAMNASQGGLLLHFSEMLPIGLYLSLKLFLPSGFTLSAIETTAKVAWTDIHLDEGGGDYRTGGEIFRYLAQGYEKIEEVFAGPFALTTCPS